MKDDYDAIIIGSGLGGLVAGAKLAKEGKRVLLLEQHFKVGGCATTFLRNGYTVEVGLHEIGGLDALDTKRKIFEELDVFSHVEFVRIPEFYRFVSGKSDIIIPDSPDAAQDTLRAAFPSEAEGIQAFFHKIFSIRKEVHRLPQKTWQIILALPLFPLLFPNLLSSARGTLAAFLDSVLHDEELKLILSANLQYYHDDPVTLSLFFFSIAQSGYYSGSYYIKGGSQKLSDYLAQFIQTHGGVILTDHEATKILAKDKKVTGVRFNDKESGQECELSSKVVIANASVPSVVNKLLQREVIPAKFIERVNKMKPSCSLLSLYLGFSKPPREVGNPCYSTFVFETVKNIGEFSRKGHSDIAERPYVFVDYSQIDSGLTSSNKGVGAICTADYASNWDGLSERAYRAKKDEIAEVLIRRLDRLIPGISQHIEYYELATPRTIQRYTMNPGGSVYGFAQIPKQAGILRVRAKAPVENLYFASAWTFPGGGFTGAIVAGYLAASEIVKKL